MSVGGRWEGGCGDQVCVFTAESPLLSLSAAAVNMTSAGIVAWATFPLRPLENCNPNPRADGAQNARLDHRRPVHALSKARPTQCKTRTLPRLTDHQHIATMLAQNLAADR